VLEAAPAEPDAPLAFAGLGDLFERLPEDVLQGLSGPQRRAVDAAILVNEAGEPAPDPETLPRAILAVLRRLSAQLATRSAGRLAVNSTLAGRAGASCALPGLCTDERASTGGKVDE
jgi:hypothetical protein